MKFNTKNISQNTVSSKNILMWTVLFLVSVIAIFTFSETTHAGLLSYMSVFFGGEQASAKINLSSGGNSQTIALLQAVSAIDPNPERSVGVIPVVGDVLVADIAFSDIYEPDTSSTQISSYIIREGDTLSGIAQMFGVSVNTILWANSISRSSALRTGQTLIILPVTGVNYVIKKGDTIKGIAIRYKADVDEILQYNDLTLDSTLVTGRTIIIPDAELQIAVPTRYVIKNNAAHDTNGPYYASYYIRPISNGTKTQGLHGYNGVDLAAPSGTPIYASAAGKIIVSSSRGWNGGYGNLVIISHNNGTQTVYAHNSKNIVSIGQYVEQGDKIALMGSTGNSTGSHVHFEIRGAKNPF